MRSRRSDKRVPFLEWGDRIRSFNEVHGEALKAEKFIGQNLPSNRAAA
jgi:hypothetical protein